MKPTFDLKKGCCNVLFCGIGGQGVLTASELAGQVVMRAGYQVKKSEVHGMSQRGGSVESHLRFGHQVHSPLIQPGQADVMVCLHPDEAARLGYFLKPGGLSFLPFLAAAHRDTDLRGINVYLCGVLAAHLPIPPELWLTVIAERIKRRPEENQRVFRQGYAAGQQSG